MVTTNNRFYFRVEYNFGDTKMVISICCVFAYYHVHYGTFFVNIPTAGIQGKTTQKVILEDAFTHSGPLIIFLLFFNVLKQRILVDRRPGNQMASRLSQVAILAIIISLAYLGYIKFKQI